MTQLIIARKAPGRSLSPGGCFEALWRLRWGSSHPMLRGPGHMAQRHPVPALMLALRGWASTMLLPWHQFWGFFFGFFSLAFTCKRKQVLLLAAAGTACCWLLTCDTSWVVSASPACQLESASHLKWGIPSLWGTHS